MAAYAKIYGLVTFKLNEIKGKEEFYTEIAKDCFMSIGDYAMLEEILEKDI